MMITTETDMITRRKRASVKVDELREHVNGMLASSTCSADHRQGMITVLQEVLHATKNYHGFSYLTKADVPYKEKPGIQLATHRDPISGLLVCDSHSFDDTDPTRRRYF